MRNYIIFFVITIVAACSGSAGQSATTIVKCDPTTKLAELSYTSGSGAVSAEDIATHVTAYGTLLEPAVGGDTLEQVEVFARDGKADVDCGDVFSSVTFVVEAL